MEADQSRPPRQHHVWIDPRFARVLADSGLSDADSLVATGRGTALRRLPHRENWRLELPSPDGDRLVFYLKKHQERTLATRCRAKLGLPLPRTPARREAEWIGELTRLGCPTMTLAAFAERLRADGTLVGAFLTPELAGFEQLDLFLTRRFQKRDDPALHALIDGCAELAGRFHRAGLNHRDFYTCHFFIREDERGRFSIRLIDLQRVQRWPAGLRRRWIVKDLAQLAYSCPRHLIGPSERIRFFKTYRRLARLDRPSKRLARAVLRREATLRRKHGSYRPEWEAEDGSHVVAPVPEAA